MGNDGGFIFKRCELVKDVVCVLIVSEFKVIVYESFNYVWIYDFFILEFLDFENVVFDWCGCFYNYEFIFKGLMLGDSDDIKIIELVNGEFLEVIFVFIGIKFFWDIVKFKVKWYIFFGIKEKGIWVCLVMLKELGVFIRFVYFVLCGYVFVEIVIK